MKRRAVEDPTAPEAEVRHDVRVGVDEAPDVTVVEGPILGHALGVQGQLRELSASRAGVERHHRRLCLVLGEPTSGQVAATRKMAELKPLRIVNRDHELPLGR